MSVPELRIKNDEGNLFDWMVDLEDGEECLSISRKVKALALEGWSTSLPVWLSNAKKGEACSIGDPLFAGWGAKKYAEEVHDVQGLLNELPWIKVENMQFRWQNARLVMCDFI